jgi:transposase-like protein
MACLSEPRNGGVSDVCIVACDGLKGLPESVAEIWPLATVQLCVVHLVRASLRYASKAHWGPITKALRPVYTAPSVAAAGTRFADFETNGAAAERIVAVAIHDVLGVKIPILSASLIITVKLRAVDEHNRDFSEVLPLVRALRE